MAGRLIGLVLLTLVAAEPAAAATPIIDRAASTSRGRSVYVHPATRLLTAVEARRVERQIEDRAQGPLLITILPAAARREVDGTTLGVALELNRRIFTTNPPAVHAVLIGNEFRAVNRDIDADRLAAESSGAHRKDGVAVMLVDFARRVGQARADAEDAALAPPEEPTADEANADLWIAAILIVATLAAAAAFAHRRHAR